MTTALKSDSLIQETQNKLLELINDPKDKFRVLVLSGCWGVWKTYFWEKILQEKINKEKLYVSAFGVKSVEELKGRILYQKYPHKRKIKYIVKNILHRVASLVIFNGVSIKLNFREMSNWIMPDVVKDTLIVIDDLERGDASFSMTEFMGFMDSCVQSGSQFLLITDTGNIQDQETWKTFHERVIDREIVFEPSIAEICAIANVDDGLSSDEHRKALLRALENCQIRSIRVMREIIRYIQEVEKVLKTLYNHEVNLRHFIGAITLLTGLYRQAVTCPELSQLSSDDVCNYSFIDSDPSVKKEEPSKKKLNSLLR